jgi:hypothetical protein
MRLTHDNPFGILNTEENNLLFFLMKPEVPAIAMGFAPPLPLSLPLRFHWRLHSQKFYSLQSLNGG